MLVRSLRKGGLPGSRGDPSREVWYNKCLWHKNDKKERVEEAKPLKRGFRACLPENV